MGRWGLEGMRSFEQGRLKVKEGDRLVSEGSESGNVGAGVQGKGSNVSEAAA
jgi:hypothetical protein